MNQNFTIQEVQPEILGRVENGRVVLNEKAMSKKEPAPTPEPSKQPTRDDLTELGKKVAEFTVSLLESEYKDKLEGKDAELKNSAQERQTEKETFKTKAKMTEETHKTKLGEMQGKHKEALKAKDMQMKEMGKTMKDMEKKMKDLLAQVKDALNEE